MCMSENQTSATEATVNSGKWIGQLVAAVILAEGIWGFLASLTNNLVVPLLAREMGSDPQSPLYLGKGLGERERTLRRLLGFLLVVAGGVDLDQSGVTPRSSGRAPRAS